MKLWEKGISTASEIEKFTVGRDREFDLMLAKHDVLGSLAHIRMLCSIGLLERDEESLLSAELKKIYGEVQERDFRIGENVEDIHSQVELMLTERLGELGKKIHSGRSRNDQVLLDIKLFLREEIRDIVLLCEEFFSLLQTLSERHKDVLLPGYTHLQIAMPSSFGLWFGAYAESLVDDVILLHAAYRIANKNPLGSAAGYGSSFPLNRTMTTELLGFEDLNYNVVYAQMGRGKTERITAQALASVAGTLGKMAMDICLYMNQNFGFIGFPDELTTGSSIMPHKKNPDVFELIRARCNRIMAVPNEITMLTANLPSGYHRDLQLLKEALFPAIADLKQCLAIFGFSLDRIIVRENILSDAKYRYLFSVDDVNSRVLAGKAFRDAYQEVGREINEGKFSFEPGDLQHSHEGSIGNPCTAEIAAMMRRELEKFSFGKVDGAVASLLA